MDTMVITAITGTMVIMVITVITASAQANPVLTCLLQL
jgi:hypothetical protein